MSPLQEAIAKAIAARFNAWGSTAGSGDGLVESLAEAAASAAETFYAEADIPDDLGVLRADDDTRYVAITKKQRDALVVLARDLFASDVYAVEVEALREMRAAYDAVAPNAKDHA